MRASQRVRIAAVVVLLSTVSIACHESTAPRTGTIEVSVKSSGSDVDPDGYLVTIDVGLTRLVAANTVTAFEEIVTGRHSVTLTNVAANCTVDGDNPRSVSVLADATVAADFPVACISRIGSIHLRISTVGARVDPDGYRLSVDGGPERVVATNDELTLTDMHEGPHILTVSDVAPNCAADGHNEHAVNVLFAKTTESVFSIVCTGTGTLNITAATTGLDLDPDGYTVTAYNDDYYSYVSYSFSVPTNGSLSVPDMEPGQYSLVVEGRAANCQVVGANPPHVVIYDQTVTSASLNLVCYGKGTLTFTGATTGVDFDPDGYTVNISSPAGSHSATVPTNGSVSLPGIVGGPYLLVVSGWAANCELAGTNPRNIVVDDKGPTSVSLNVSCAAVRRLAYVVTASEQTDIYTINSNGTASTRLTTNAASDEEPAWSPDGSTIAFATNRDGAFRIYLMNADGSNPRPVGSADANARQPTWSPDGRRIAFAGSTPDLDREIYVMNADGTDVVRLTQSAGDDAEPAWSPDGTKIAFRSTRTGSAELYVMNADGSNVTRLTTTALDERKPAWSPDGSKIVFAAGGCDFYYGCYSDLYVMNANGSGTSQLTSGALSSSPAWSPDGAWIAFVITECDSQSRCDDRLAMVKANGTAGGTITAGHASQPAWRP